MSDAPDSRRPLKVEVDVQFDGHSGRERHTDALLYPKGLLLRTRYLKAVGTGAEFEIFVVEGEAPLRGRGPVVFSRWQDQGARKPAGLGLRVDEWLDDSGPRAAQWFDEPVQVELPGSTPQGGDTPTDLSSLPARDAAADAAARGVAPGLNTPTVAEPAVRWEYASSDAGSTVAPEPAAEAPFVPVWTPPDGSERPGNAQGSNEYSLSAPAEPASAAPYSPMSSFTPGASATPLASSTPSSPSAPLAQHAPPPFAAYAAEPMDRTSSPPAGTDVPVGRDGSVVWAPAERRGRWLPWIGGGLVLGALLAGGYWFYATRFAAPSSTAQREAPTASAPAPTTPPASGASSASGAPATPESAAPPALAAPPASSVTNDTTASAPPNPAAPPAAANTSEATGASSATPLAVATPAPTPAPASLARFHAVRAIRVDRDEDGLVVAVELDGRVAKGDFERFRLDAPTREVLRLKGVTEAYGQPRIVVGDALLQSVRTGIQPGNALHVVLDLPRSGIRVEAPVIDGSRLLLRVRG